MHSQQLFAPSDTGISQDKRCFISLVISGKPTNIRTWTKARSFVKLSSIIWDCAPWLVCKIK